MSTLDTKQSQFQFLHHFWGTTHVFRRHATHKLAELGTIGVPDHGGQQSECYNVRVTCRSQRRARDEQRAREQIPSSQDLGSARCAAVVVTSID